MKFLFSVLLILFCFEFGYTQTTHHRFFTYNINLPKHSKGAKNAKKVAHSIIYNNLNTFNEADFRKYFCRKSNITLVELKQIQQRIHNLKLKCNRTPAMDGIEYFKDNKDLSSAKEITFYSLTPSSNINFPDGQKEQLLQLRIELDEKGKIKNILTFEKDYLVDRTKEISLKLRMSYCEDIFVSEIED